MNLTLRDGELGWWLAIAFCALSIVCIWIAAPRKVRVVAGRVR